MATIEEQIKSLEDEIGKTQKNKATNAHIGKLKAKIAALRARKEKAQAHAKASGGGPGFEVKKSGFHREGAKIEGKLPRKIFLKSVLVFFVFLFTCSVG